VKVLPRDLVDAIDVDLSILKEIWDSLKLSELGIDTEKFEILTSETAVVTASKPAKIEEITDEVEDVPVTWADEPTDTEETEK
jgi:hypothetical protein